jgi:transposase
LRTSANNDSAGTEDVELGGGDDGSTERRSGELVRIPKGHLLRRIDVFVAPVLDDMRRQLEPYYSEIGRPSVDPALMLRMLIVGYSYGVRSERQHQRFERR